MKQFCFFSLALNLNLNLALNLDLNLDRYQRRD